MFAWMYRMAIMLRHDRRAVTALEYSLIAALIGLVIIAGVTTLGTKINGVFTSIAGKI